MAIIKSKEYIRFWIATGVFILIVVLVGATIWMKKEIKPEVILSVVGGYAALYFGLNKHWMEGDKMFRELFTEFNDRFNEMNEDLNKIFNNDKREDGKIGRIGFA